VKSFRAAAGACLRLCVPAALRARIPVRAKARARAILRIEPWPDLAVRHPLFRTGDYRALRERARPFDQFRKPYKPPIERGHQTSYLVSRWFAAAGVKTAFHAGYSNGRYLFYLGQAGIECGGTDLALDEAPENQIPAVFEARVLRRLLRADFFEMTPGQIAAVWDRLPIDVLFTEATFETLFPWRKEGFSVAKYRAAEASLRRALLYERLPAKLAELGETFSNMIFIEPEPAAGGAGEVFGGYARALPAFEYSVWAFRPPFDRLFRLSPSEPTKQAVYAFVRDPAVLGPLRDWADRI